MSDYVCNLQECCTLILLSCPWYQGIKIKLRQRVWSSHPPESALEDEPALQTLVSNSHPGTPVISSGHSVVREKRNKEDGEKIHGLEYFLPVVCLASLASHLVFLLESAAFSWEGASHKAPLPRPSQNINYGFCCIIRVWSPELIDGSCLA